MLYCHCTCHNVNETLRIVWYVPRARSLRNIDRHRAAEGSVALTLIPMGWAISVAVLLGFWGLMATAAPVDWWSWVAQAHAGARRGWRWTDGGSGLVVHRPRLKTRRTAVRQQWLSKYICSQFDRASGGGLADFPHLTLKGASECMRLSRDRSKSEPTDFAHSHH